MTWGIGVRDKWTRKTLCSLNWRWDAIDTDLETEDRVGEGRKS